MRLWVLLTLPAAAICLAWLVAAPMPPGLTRRTLVRLARRVSRAYVFGGLIGALFGAAICPDHFRPEGIAVYVGAWALIGIVLWGLGSPILDWLTHR